VWGSSQDTTQLQILLQASRELGFDAFELPLERLNQWDPARLGDTAKSLGMILVVCVAIDKKHSLVDHSPRVRRETVSFLREAVDITQTVGAGTLCGALYSPVGWCPRWSPSQRAKHLAYLSDSWLELAEHADGRGVRVAIEPLNRYETSVFNTVGQLADALVAARHPSLGIAADAFHMNIEERDVHAALVLSGDSLFHVQVAGNDRGAPGGDSFRWDVFRAGLDQVDYSGVVSIESFSPHNEALARAASVWRPLAKSPGQLAKDGLQFLRQSGVASASLSSLEE